MLNYVIQYYSKNDIRELLFAIITMSSSIFIINYVLIALLDFNFATFIHLLLGYGLIFCLVFTFFYKKGTTLRIPKNVKLVLVSIILVSSALLLMIA